MICKSCGGIAYWRGPLSALTHTECGQCGAVNNHFDENLQGREAEPENDNQ